MPTRQRPRRRHALALLVLAAVPFITGCGLTPAQTDTIDRFAVATQTVADLSAREIMQVRRDVIELRTAMLALAPGSIDAGDPANDLDGPLDPDDADARLAAAQTLQHFAELLRDLAAADSTDRLSAAADALVTGLRGIDRVHLSPGQGEAVRDAVAAVGQWTTAAMRQRAVQQAVLQTRDAVRSLTDELRGELDPHGQRWAATLTETVHQIDATLARRIATDAAGKPADADSALRHDRFLALSADAQRRMQAYEQAHAQIAAALDAFDEAHAALVYVVQAHGIESPDIDAFFQRAERLLRIYKLIRDQP
jgi:hypothetical protein